MKYESCLKAIEWWVADIARPKFDNGEPSQKMMMMIKEMTNNSLPLPTPLQAYNFMVMLEEKIVSDIEAYGSCNLRVDYEADGILAECLNETGIQRALSWKTSMNITPNSVKVRHGYGADEQTIYQSKQLGKE